jgi:hypothetical protein
MRSVGTVRRRPLGRWTAAAILGAYAIVAVASASAVRSPAASVPAGGEGDVPMYQSIVMRLRAGEPYYLVVGDELHQRGYATYPAFNWRTPLTFTALSLTPQAVAHGALLALAAAVVVAAIVATPAAGPRLVVGAWQVGTLLAVGIPVATLMAEAWSGMLIALAVCAHSVRRSAIAVPAGALALATRELAAPYCVVATVLAAKARRWREVAAWGAVATIYAVYFAWHLSNVWAHQLPAEVARHSSWLQLGGLTFVTATVGWEGWLLLLPWPATSIALALLVAGIGSSETPTHVRLVSAAYLIFFYVAGQTFNAYWGLVAGPTWAVASAYGCYAVSHLVAEILHQNGRAT